MSSAGNVRNPYIGRQAPSTQTGKEYAKVIFDTFQQKRHDPVMDELQPIDVEGDNLEHVLCSFGDYLRSNKILQKNTTGKYQSPATKGKIFERAKALLKLKFSHHDCWADEGWYHTLRKQIEDTATRHAFETGEDDYRDPSTCLIYSQIVDPAVFRVTNRINDNWQAQPGIDLRSILSSMKKRPPTQIATVRSELSF